MAWSQGLMIFPYVDRFLMILIDGGLNAGFEPLC